MLCTTCFQEQDERVLKAINAWPEQEKGIPLAAVLDVYPEESQW
ncbi:MAG TPA: hypothetical protein VKB76_18710 [Ktedonobacterales bacterium]|nr:hypothetical protein [Ktedonobacterales bacterium]